MVETKKNLRNEMRARLLAQSSAERAVRSLAIQKKLWAMPIFQNATLVLFFASMPEEVDTHGMIDRAISEGKRVALPISDLATKELFFYEIKDPKKDLKQGVYGILSPDPLKTKRVILKDVGCVMVPGVLFDLKKNRVGHGAGFYDRFLSQNFLRTPKIGLCYSFQVVEELPTESHDVAVDELITD